MDLPTGTVTFLFTDIEGSTRLIDELGEEGYVEALAEHRRLLRAVFSARAGIEVDTQGDAFLYAFRDPAAAVAAAGQGQQELAAMPVKVRMGLHSGEPLLTGEGYAGRELHLAARIAAAGHGGQVVVSAVTRALVGGGELRELGEHRLKDFDEPIALFQLGVAEFPPLKTISNTNLPRPASSFVGRERERAEVVQLVRKQRLVTLSGSGGSGKTRLSIEAAAELVGDFKAGVFWIGLAALRDPALVLETVAQRLGAKNGVAEHVGEREMLLLLDNLEQVIEVARDLASLVETCPNLHLLVTSRGLLRVPGEVEYPVPPLDEPEAAALFVERARLTPDETITELCRRLDNLPLAVELAAARARVLSPAQILERLGKRPDLLQGGRGIEARQQTLRATMEWSHDLLEPAEQRLFARLAVFRGGCDLDAAEAVAGAELDTLASLVDKSLVRRVQRATSEPRFAMLETIRAFAVERLEQSGESENLRRRHCLHLLAGVEAAEAAFVSSAEPGDAFLGLLDEEHDNLRAALAWAAEAGELELEVRLAVAARWFWVIHGHLSEVRRFFDGILERTVGAPRPLRALALVHGAVFPFRQGESRLAARLWQEALDLYRELGDTEGAARSMAELGAVAMAESDFDRAAALYGEAATSFRGQGRTSRLAVALGNLGAIAKMRGDYATAVDYLVEAIALARGAGEDDSLAISLHNLARAELALQRPDEGRAALLESLALARRLGYREALAYCLGGLAELATLEGDAKRAATMLGASEHLFLEVGAVLDPDEVRSQERVVGFIVGVLGEEGARELRADAEGLTLEELLEA